MIRAVAIDDEPLSLELIETFSKQYSFLHLEKSFTSTAAAKQYLEKNKIDLLFLDIRMPAISGIDFYTSLLHKPMLIFTTSYSEYALQGYELNAVDYLMKPFTAVRFGTAVQKAKELYDLVNNATVVKEAKFIMLRVDYGMVKIVLSNILFIEGLDNYLKIHLQGSQPIVVRLTMKALMEKLNEHEFVRVHRSYIVAIDKIETLKPKLITIAGEEIPIGKNYEDGLKSLFKTGGNE